jgi:hypothetical protein
MATQTTEEEKKVEETKQKKPNVFIAIAVLLLIVVIILVVLLFSKRDTTTTDTQESTSVEETTGIAWDSNAEEGDLEHMSQEEIQAALDKKVEESMIEISMNTSPVFADGTSKGNLGIVNSENNNYPQVVYIVLQDTGEEIYRSGAIAVGSKIEEAALDVDLDAGTYPCVAYFNMVNMDTGEFIGTAAAEIEITVQN